MSEQTNKTTDGDKPDYLIELIVALTLEYAIGRDNRLPWRLPSDLRRFKRLTEGKAVFMGRKTWESLPDEVRPLPGRENFVLSRNPHYTAPGAQVVSAPEHILRLSSPAVVIGGGEIYRLLLPHAQVVHCTLVKAAIDMANAVRFPFDLLQESFTQLPGQSDDAFRLRDKDDEYKTAYARWEKKAT